MLVIEKLKNIIIQNQNNIEYSIAEYLLISNTSGVFPRNNELSKILNIHKSTLTQFAKKIGYEGYKELIIRLMVEQEFYGTKSNNDVTLKKREDLLITFQDGLIDFVPYLSRFAQMIKLSKKVFIVASYEMDSKSINLFAHGLNNFRPTFCANNRKVEQEYIAESTKDDLIIFFVTGLDTNETNLLIKKAYNQKLSYIVFSTKSQLSKLSILNPNNYLVINEVTGYSSEIRQLIRHQQIIRILMNLLNMSIN